MRRGTVLADRYELDQEVGRGGMGEVWRAYDQLLDRRLAVKFIFAHGRGLDDDLRGRFEQEARSTAWLEHPGVPTVYDFGEYQDEAQARCLYLVMQYVDGMTVDHLMDMHAVLPISWAALIAAQVCAVLAVAHQRPLVHRDLKPGNLMLSADGTVKVLDFGVAVGLAPNDVRKTLTGVGGPYTPGYTAPEQMYGSPGPQSDIYSLGCVLYEMLTGRRVFLGETPYEIMRRHEDDDPVPPRELRPEIPAGLEELVLGMLAKRPADRSADAFAVYERLLDFVSGLEPLPGVVDGPVAASGLARMYGGALARIRFTDRGVPAPVVGLPSVEVPAVPQVPVELPALGDVERARAEAAELAAAGRFTQAAELLSDLIEPAVLSLGDDEPEVLALRLALAEVLFDGGDHRRAVPAYRAAAVGLAEWYGPDDAKVLHCREQEAASLAQLGDTDRAISHLESLLTAVAGGGPYDLLALRLRERIGRLRLAAGQVDRAGRELSALLDDLRERYGADHPRTRDLKELLDDLPH